MDGRTTFLVFFVPLIAWLFYMMTFRTRDFIDLVKAEEERKKSQRAFLGKAAKGAWFIGSKFLKK